MKKQKTEHKVKVKKDRRCIVRLLPQAIEALEDLCSRRHLLGENRIATAIEMLILDEMVHQMQVQRIAQIKQEFARSRS